MTRAILPMTMLLTVLGVASCFRDHPMTDTAVRGEECVTCHLPDYAATTQPVHAGNYPQTCADCHVTTYWQPALDGNHPEDKFPIAKGAHTGIACMSCHDLDLGASSAAGANTNCIQCHHQSDMDPQHGGVSGYHYDTSQPHFCLACHPDGMGGKHPESKFPITSGPHRGIACGDCHKASLGTPDSIDNTDCVTCHTDAHHRDPSKPHDCLRCHPNGYAGD